MQIEEGLNTFWCGYTIVHSSKNEQSATHNNMEESSKYNVKGNTRLQQYNFIYAKFKTDEIDVVKNNAISYFLVGVGVVKGLGGSLRGFGYLGDILSPSGCCLHRNVHFMKIQYLCT